MTVAPEEVLAAWFGAPGEEAEVARRQTALWWGKDEATDRELAARFGSTVEAALTGGLAAWSAEPSGRLALVLVLDQLPRSIYRGTPAAFAGDHRAQLLTLDALENGEDRCLRLLERVFLYLPLEHAEDLELQERSVELFRELLGAAPPAQHELFAGFLDYAVAHRDIIARFGRFPHRNSILGRRSSAEEEEFLLQPGSSF